MKIVIVRTFSFKRFNSTILIFPRPDAKFVDTEYCLLNIESGKWSTKSLKKII